MRILTIVLLIYSFSLKSQISNNLEIHKCSKSKFKSAQASNPALADYDVKFYGLDLIVLNTNTYIEGSTRIKALVVNPIDTFVCQFVTEYTVDSILLFGQSVNFSHSNVLIKVFLPTTYNTGDYVDVRIYYNGDASGNPNYSGLSNGTSPSWGKNATWSLSESYHAKEWFPCKEDLTDKADSAYIFITTSSNCKAGSNGKLTNVVQLPNSLVRYEWKTYYPIAYYLISVSVSEYIEYNIYAKPNNVPDSILVQNYIYSTSGCLSYFKNYIDQTSPMIVLFSDLFGLYPFSNEKYGHAMAPISGGMEHQTMTTLGWFDFKLVSHELGHQWFGDNVTCKTWQDIWVNEGFASYSEYLASQYLQSQSAANTWLNDYHAAIMQTAGGSVYVPFASIYNEGRIFDYRLSYQKGAVIVHQIRYLINNDSIFFDFLKDLNDVYRDSVATGDDIKDFLFTKTNIDFTDYFNQWYYGEGYPTYSLQWSQTNDSLFLNINQSTSTTITQLFTIPVEFRFNYSGGDTIIRLNQDANFMQYRIKMPYTITSINVDPNNWILNKVGSIVVGNNIISNNVISVYPNPVNDKLIINNFNSEYKTAILYSYDGKIITSFCLTNENFIEFKDFDNGIYFLKFISPKSEQTRRIVKN